MTTFDKVLWYLYTDYEDKQLASDGKETLKGGVYATQIVRYLYLSHSFG
jgi:hypothetical protein